MSQLLESHISYPAVAFFPIARSTPVVELLFEYSAPVEAGILDVPTWQAHVTFAMARHAAVDLRAQVLRADTQTPLAANRLGDDRFGTAAPPLRASGLSLCLRQPHPRRDARAACAVRTEPYVAGLAAPWRCRCCRGGIAEAVRDTGR